MHRTTVMILVILCITLFVGAETISLTGTVKKNGTAIPGVKVSLKKFPGVSATTITDGSFALTGSTAVLSQTEKSSPIQFVFRNNAIIFSPMETNLNGYVDIFSSDGKRKLSVNLKDIKASNRSVTIPELGSGINIVRITTGTESYTHELVSLGDGLFLRSDIPDAINPSNFRLAKHVTAAVVDTLIAEKTGYTIGKTPITGYSQQNITITIDTAEGTTPGKCTREDLKAMTDKYIEAQTAGDPTKMPLAADVKVIENNKDTSLAKSIFKQALKIDFNLSIYDLDSCRTFTEVIVANSTPAYVIGTRLRVKDGKITELNAIVTDKNSWLFNAANYLKYAKQQNWYVLSASERSTREQLIDAGNQYLDIFNGDDKDVPFGGPCYRIEGGTSTFQGDTTADYCYTTSQEVLKANGNKPFLIGNRNFIVDVDLGAVDVFCSFCKLDSHLFRLVHGKFRYVHTLSVGCQ
jgi:hypothetical protein